MLLDEFRGLFTPLTEAQVFCNGRIKVAPDGQVIEAVWASRPVFKRVASEPLEPVVRGPKASGGGGDLRAAKRAKKRLYELCRCNCFDTFITLTLSPQEIDRYDIKEITKKLNVWLDNRVRRKGLRYVLVPERHKDGAIHFHGLVNGEALKLQDSGHRDNAGRMIFNVIDWKLGFTTGVKVDENYERVCNYVAKYITKQYDSCGPSGADAGPIGGRWFYHGGALNEPAVLYFDMPERPASGQEFPIEGAGLTLVYLT